MSRGITDGSTDQTDRGYGVLRTHSMNTNRTSEFGLEFRTFHSHVVAFRNLFLKKCGFVAIVRGISLDFRGRDEATKQEKSRRASE